MEDGKGDVNTCHVLTAVTTITTIIVLTTNSVTAPPATAMLRRTQASNTGTPRLSSVQQRYIPI